MPIDTLTSAAQTDRISYLTTTTNLPHVRREATGYPSFDSIESVALPKERHFHPFRIAGKVVKVAMVTIAISGTLFVVSTAMGRLGTLLRASTVSNSGKLAQIGARTAFWLSEAALWAKRGSQALFLAVTVPPYMILYQFPRWLLIERLPLVLSVSRQWAQTVNLLIRQIARNINVRLIETTHRIRELTLPYILHSRQWIKTVSKQWLFLKESFIRGWQWSQLKAIDLARSALNALKEVVYLTKESLLQLVLRYRYISQRISQTTQAIAKNLFNATFWTYRTFQPFFDSLFAYSLQLGKLIKETASGAQAQLTKLAKTASELFVKAIGHTMGALWASIERLQSSTTHLLTLLTPTLHALAARMAKIKSFFAHAGQKAMEIMGQSFRSMVKSGRLMIKHLATWSQWLQKTIGPALKKMNDTLQAWGSYLAPHIKKIATMLTQASLHLAAACKRGALATAHAAALAIKYARAMAKALKPYLKYSGTLIATGAKHFRGMIAHGLGTFWVFLRRMRDTLVYKT